MKTIKFREDSAQDAFFTSLRAEVNGYLAENGFDGFATTKVWLKGLFYVSLQVVLYAALVAGHLAFWPSLLVWSLLGVNGILIGLNIAHDAAHDALSANKRVNSVIYFLTFNALGANGYLWQLRHVQSHHLFPNVDDCDADIDDNPLIRLSPHKPARGYQRWQHLYAPVAYLFYTLVWILVKDFIILRKKRLANLRGIRHPAREVWLFFLAKIVYFGYMLAIPMWCMELPWYQVVAGFVCMHFSQSYAFIFGLIASHFSMEPVFPKVDAEGYLPGSWASHQMAASLDYHATAAWANFIFGGFNAHVAHHLFPHVSHVHYPVISRMIAEKAAIFGLPYHHTTLVGAVASHFRYLEKMGKYENKHFDML